MGNCDTLNKPVLDRGQARLPGLPAIKANQRLTLDSSDAPSGRGERPRDFLEIDVGLLIDAESLSEQYSLIRRQFGEQ